MAVKIIMAVEVASSSSSRGNGLPILRPQPLPLPVPLRLPLPLQVQLPLPLRPPPVSGGVCGDASSVLGDGMATKKPGLDAMPTADLEP